MPGMAVTAIPVAFRPRMEAKKPPTPPPIMDIMKEREFIFTMEARDGKGKTIAYYFLSKCEYHRHHKDQIVIPPYNCIVYPESGEFKFAYAVPKSINVLETPKCGSFENNDHFYNICTKFDNSVRVLYQAFGDE